MKKLFFLSLLAFAACKKNNEPPLGASNGGQSYLSCKINGKQYTFTGKPVGLNPDGVSYGYGLYGQLGGGVNRNFWISAHNLGYLNAHVYIDLGADTSYRFPLNRRISFSEVTQKEVYVLLRSPIDFGNSYYYAGSDGWINLTRTDSIGAGTFGFNAYPIDNNGQRIPGSDSIIVTDGRFDIHK